MSGEFISQITGINFKYVETSSAINSDEDLELDDTDYSEVDYCKGSDDNYYANEKVYDTEYSNDDFCQNNYDSDEISDSNNLNSDEGLELYGTNYADVDHCVSEEYINDDEELS